MLPWAITYLVRYIQSLILRLDSLNAKHAAVTHQLEVGRRAQPDSIANLPTTHQSQDGDGSPSIQESEPTSGHGGDFDNHFPVPSMNGSTSRFYGSSSVFALAVEDLTLASNKGLFSPSAPLDPLLSTGNGHDSLRDLDAVASTAKFDTGRDFVQSLIADYMASINAIHPCVDGTHLEEDLDQFLEMNRPLESDLAELQRMEKYQIFRVAMMCSISCAAKSRHTPSLVAYGNQFYSQAVRYVEEVTAEVSPQSLEALLLLVIYCLFNPRKGNIWKLLDFACRLSVQLGYHTEQGHSMMESEDEKTWRRTAFWSLYSIERLVGQCFGRPSDLPSSIVTTQYPTILTDPILLGDESRQKVSATQVFHLMFLRSEIYTEIYLSAASPLPKLDWSFERYTTLRQWYQQPSQSPLNDYSNGATGVCEVSRDIMYHSSVLFLFQRHLIEVLATARHNNTQRDFSQLICPLTVPTEPYHSAKALLRLYTLTIRSTASTPFLSLYPVTFLSAYSIFQAGMTLLSYGLLSLEMGIGFQSSSSPHTSGQSDTEMEMGRNEETKLDFADFLSLSNDCLVLLAWCKEQWPGMEGMVDAFARCSAETARQVLRA